MERRIWATVVLAAAVTAIGVVLWYTRDGIGVNDDGVMFVEGAHNLLAGRGFSWLTGAGEARRITGFPPGFSLLLALVGLSGMDLYQGARLLNALSFGGSILLTGLLVLKTTRSGPAASLASLLILVSPQVFRLHVWTMADGLFLLLLLLTLYAAGGYVASGSPLALVAASLATALAIIVRYAGLALVVAPVLAVLLLKHRPWNRRLVDLMVATLVPLIPFVALGASNTAAGGSAVNRELALLMPRPETLVAYLREMSSWFLPFGLTEGMRGRVMGTILLVLGGVPLSLFFLGAWKGHGGQDAGRFAWLPAMPALIVATILAYLVVLVATISYFDLNLGTVERYLSPVFALSVALGTSVVCELVWRGPGWRAAKVVCLLGAVVVAAGLASETMSVLRAPAPQWGYNEWRRRNPEAVQVLRSLNPSRPVVTNEIYLFLYLSDRPADQVPILYDSYLVESRDDVPLQMEVYRDRMEAGAILVLFDTVDAQEGEFPSRETLIQGLERLAAFAGGEVYDHPGH